LYSKQLSSPLRKTLQQHLHAHEETVDQLTTNQQSELDQQPILRLYYNCSNCLIKTGIRCQNLETAYFDACMRPFFPDSMSFHSDCPTLIIA